jgi:hypothetical protein
MQKERRQENAGRRIEPKNCPVERVQLAGIAEGKQHERDQADVVEMNNMRRS